MSNLASPSSRRAWIEIPKCGNVAGACFVALLAEGVDRNMQEIVFTVVDNRVALLAEGVDRNPRGVVGEQLLHPSPSSRRAWIEIRW